jgi:hypothetical protein
MKLRIAALAALMTLVCLFSACGGSGTDPSDATVAAVQANAAKKSTPSASGATINSTTGTLVDASGNVWGLKSSANNGLQVTKNGKLAGFTADVALVLYYNGAVYQENTASLWWPWSGSTWTGSGVSDPRTASTGTGTGGTGSGGGNTDAGSSGSGGSTGTGSTGTTGSSGSAAPTGVQFYGVNGHYTQGGIYATNITQQVKDMQAMGIKSIRQDCYSTSDTATMASLISSFSPIVIQPMFDVYPSTTDETTAYNQFYAYGQTVAGQLAGKVPVIELMNEPENQYFSNGPSDNGQLVTNWSASNSQWPAFRGAVRGFIAGFRSVDTTKQTLIASPSVGWLHYGLLEGLWNGTAPDGSSGHPTAQWDITNYHWYYDMGDIETAGGVNTLSVLHTAFDEPILLTEVGVQTSVSSTVYDSYVGTALAEFAGAAAKAYDIIGIDWYELYNFDNNGGFYMGLYTSPGVVNAGRATAMTSAITANPNP